MFTSPHNNRRKVDSLLACNLLAGSVACFCLAACTVGPDYHSPVMDMPKSFVATSPEGQKPAEDSGNKPVIDAAKWWEALGDQELNSLIDRAVRDNPDIEIALDRMQEARTAEIVVLGEALPVAGASAGGGRGTGSDISRGRAAPPLVAADNTKVD